MNNLERWFKRNALAEKKESEGKSEDAIELYEANVEEDAETLFTYERLSILYRRRGDRQNERRILSLAISKLKYREEHGPWDENLAQQLQQFYVRLEELESAKKNPEKKKGWFNRS